MLRFCLLLLAGACLLSASHRLPPDGLLLPALGLAVLLLSNRRGRWAGAAACGAIAAWWAGHAAIEARLPTSSVASEFTFNAEIIEFTKEKSGSLSVLAAPATAHGLPGVVRLALYDSPAVPQPGDTWRFTARLRAPRGVRNPGGFDFAGWMHREGIGASGYALDARYIGPGRRRVADVRRAIVARIGGLLPDDDAAAVLTAITTGARHRISAPAWQRYARTGTSHLVAISGLHVGLAAAAAATVAWLLLGLLWPRGRLRDGAAVAGLVAACLYAAIAGLALPAQRAMAMAGVAAACLLLRRRIRAASGLAALAALLFLVDPLSLLTPGFVLSFGAVGVLMLASCTREAAGEGGSAWRRSLRRLWPLQAALLLGLFPLVAGHFGRVSLVAPLANLLVLPVFSLFTVPVALLGVLFDGPLAFLGDGLLKAAWFSLRATELAIVWLAALPASGVYVAVPDGAARLLLVMPLIALLPPAWPGRHLGWLAVLAACLYRPPAPPERCVAVHTLDVGQGLVQVVRTRNQVLVFDTGPSFRGGGSSAQTALLPFLRRHGVRRLDTLVVSHADQDHAGGVADTLAAFPVISAYAGEAVPGLLAVPCLAGQRWQTDGIDFRFVHPWPGHGREGNAASCVLEIQAGEHRALLTGDIEVAGENRLVASGLIGTQQLVSVPHHGSRTSSGSRFIAAVSADTAVVSAGFANRWGFPLPDVVARWRQPGTRVMTTARSGAIEHHLCRNGGLRLVDEYRESRRRYWHVDDGR